MHFVDVFIRQAHPGEHSGAYGSDNQKYNEARTYKRDEGIDWPVLIDDLAGTTHQTYGNLPDPVYVIDADGRVAFYGMWTHVPTLQQAIEALLAQGGRGVPGAGGIDHVPHLFASFVGGWRALRRGGVRALVDYELGTPPAATLTFLGHLAKPVLAPVALRVTPLPAAARFALGGGVAAVLAVVVLVWRRWANGVTARRPDTRYS